jgi:hypothetical protein
MKLRPDETLLTGSWLYVDHVMRGDAVCDRIEWLIKNHLKKIASSPLWGDWESLFQDPSDGRYWEITYPHGDLQGGGPPQLKVISENDGKEKYGI